MKLAIYGYGGHAREVAAQIGKEVEFFVDDKYSNTLAKRISTFNPSTHCMMVAVGNSRDRSEIVSRLPNDTVYFTFIHPTALILDSTVEIGEGSFIGAYSVLTTNIKIGNHAILSRANHIGHDTSIGHFFSAMPGAIISGNVQIDNGVYIGSGSTVKEKIYIHRFATIGMGAAVVKNINNSETYVGVPAKDIKL